MISPVCHSSGGQCDFSCVSLLWKAVCYFQRSDTQERCPETVLSQLEPVFSVLQLLFMFVSMYGTV